MTDRLRVFDTTRSWINGAPVWPHDRVVAEWGRQFYMYRWAWDEPDGGMFHEERDDYVATFEMRWDYVEEFGFAIPCAELLDVLRELQPIVEVGAGTGFLTRLARNRGVDVIGTDPRLRAYKKFKHARYDDQQLAMQAKTAARRFRDRTVFCSWPCYDTTWFRQMLRAMRVGQRLVVVREDATGSEDAWQYARACFSHDRVVKVPAWPLTNDRVEVMTKMRDMSRAEVEADWEEYLRR